MRITFFSNFLNHHEIPLCDALYHLPEVQFYFVQTEPMHEERILMGWNLYIDKYPYLKLSYNNPEIYNECLKLGKESDVVIFGSASYEFIAERVKNNKLTFYYAERLFRKSFLRAFYPPSTIKIFKRFIRPGWNSNFHMLCASGYTSYDVSRIFTFKNRCYRWGHFPQFIEYKAEELISGKPTDPVQLLWVGRFIDLKHPQHPILIAKKLKEERINFSLNIIGTGELEDKLKHLIEINQLSDCVEITGSMDPRSVRRYMENANIYLFTSGFQEGWGAVLYEAMNSGCAIVASHAIGAVPLLLEHNKNGLIYKNADLNDLYNKVRELIGNKSKREILGKNAYNSLYEQWNGEVAAIRLYQFASNILLEDNKAKYEIGPMSIAPKLKNNWFRIN